MESKDIIVPVRMTASDRARIRRAAGEEPVSSWLRRLALAEARRREAAAGVSRRLDDAVAEGFGIDEAKASRLAAEAIREVRKRRR